MKINAFQFEDKPKQWKLDTTSFDRLTLLVGASGVGKTQILNAINALKQISKGEAINGIVWNVAFTATSGSNFRWEGAFEEQQIVDFGGNESEVTSDKSPKIMYEKIWKNSELVVRRDDSGVFFGEEETIKLTREKSLLNHLEEDFVNEMKEELEKIYLNDYTDSIREPSKINPFNINKLSKKYNSIKNIRESSLGIRIKLYLAYHNAIPVFNKIKERFIDIFPQVEDVKIAPIDFEGDDLPLFLQEYHFIQIKESGVPKWIPQNRISSGMFRTLTHIGELYLSAEGTLFLIDEFENSLGINCIDELTSDIMQSRRDLQFILTSHHPYIINAINFKHWKLVTRNGGVVRTHNAEKFNLGKSKHDAFMQLLQLEEFQTGSAIA